MVTRVYPALNLAIDRQMNWAGDAALKQQYIQAPSEAAHALVFIPPLAPGGYNSLDILNKMTGRGKADAKKLLDHAAQ